MSDNDALPENKTPSTTPDVSDKGVVAPSTTGERFSEKLYLAVIVAALSFVGSAAGSLLTFRAETNKWEREMTFSQKKEIFAKRMELLERTIKIVNHLQTLDMYQSASNYSLVEGGSMVRQNHPASRSLDPVADSVVKIKEAQAELSVTNDS